MPAPGRYGYQKMASYPRLRPEDQLVWERFLDLNPNKDWKVDYDVKVGMGRTPLEDLPEQFKKDWKDLTRKRIDVVAWAPNAVYIIEIKPRAGLSAVGQVLGYVGLWEDLHNQGRKIVPMILCFECDPDTLAVAKAANITVEIVPSAFA